MIYFESTGVKTAILGRNASEVLLRLNPDRAKFPLLLSFNFMVTEAMGEGEDQEGEDDQAEEEVEEVQAQQQQ